MAVQDGLVRGIGGGGRVCVVVCRGGGERACAYEVASFVHSGFWLDGLGLC